MPNTSTPGINPYLASLSPNQQQSYADLQQKQMIGQALLGQGLTPLDTSNRTAGNTVYRVSPVEGLAKLAQAYVGAKLSRDGMAGQNALMAQSLQGAFGSDSENPAYQSGPAVTGDANTGAMSGVSAGMGSAAPQPSQQALGQALMGNGAAPVQSTAAGPLTLPGQTAARSRLLYMLAPQAYQQALAAGLSPTDATKSAIAAGMDPRQVNAASIAKSTYIPPVSTRPGGGYVTGDGVYHATPSSPPQGYINVADGATPAGFRTVAVPGGLDAESASAAAKAQGAAQYKLTEVYDPGTGQMRRIPVSTVADASGQPGARPPLPPPGYTGGTGGVPPLPPGTDGGAGQGYPSIGAPGGAAPTGGSTPQGYPTIGGFASGPPLGVAAGAQAAATNQQGELSKAWTAQQAANQQAQTTNSYLDNIRQLAPKAALGALSDKITFANSLLSSAGISDRATDAATANNLLDKYSNQITARLGTGDLGSDAARRILQSAYPNSHMTLPAIQEAVGNLVGANQLTQARTNVLQPFAAQRDKAAYDAAATKFDQNADPRIWQLQSMSPQEQSAYVASLAPNVAAQLLKQRQVLKGMGALQ